MHRAALATLLLASLALAPLAPAAEHDLPTSGALPGTGWVAVRVHTDGARASLTLVAQDLEAPYGAGGVVYKADGDVVSRSGVLKPKREFGASVALGPVDQDVRLLQNVTERDAFGATVENRRGEFVLVTWFAARASGPMTWTFTGGPGVTLLGVAQGDDTWVLNGADFPQVAGARVAAGVSETPRAQLRAVHERVLDGRPVWWYFSSTAGLSAQRAQDFLFADTPAGTFDCGAPLLDHSCIRFEPGLPGAYRWSADGAGVNSVWLMGANPRWP